MHRLVSGKCACMDVFACVHVRGDDCLFTCVHVRAYRISAFVCSSN